MLVLENAAGSKYKYCLKNRRVGEILHQTLLKVWLLLLTDSLSAVF